MAKRFSWDAVRRAWLKTVLGLAFVGVAAWAVCWGRNGSLPRAEAVPQPAAAAQAVPSDYSQRVVAYIYGNTSITREQLGEYLIARYGADKLELLVNKCIIDQACREHGVEVTAAEIDAALASDLDGMQHLPLADFVSKVLKPYHKTLYEWKEDVIRPRLALTKLCRDRVHVTPEDLRMAFEAHYGEKVECKIIMWPKAELNVATMEYEKIRDSEEEFARKATHQASAQLSANGGLIQPIGHHTTGNQKLEDEAFRLRPGEISAVIETPEGHVVVKCIKRVPPDSTKSLDDVKVRAELEKEVFDKKIQGEIPAYFSQLRMKADPKLILKKVLTEEDLVRDVREQLMPGSAQTTGPKTTPPQGN